MKTGNLTPRELEILRMSSLGTSDVIQKLGISRNTFLTHWCNIRTKLNATSRIQALVKALKLNLISLDEIKGE